ncbi:MAG TPA: hypothetical protein VIJ94_17805 [Caulobacteraceae bacterium]
MSQEWSREENALDACGCAHRELNVAASLESAARIDAPSFCEHSADRIERLDGPGFFGLRLDHLVKVANYGAVQEPQDPVGVRLAAHALIPWDW